MDNFVAESLALGLFQLRNLLELAWVLGDESTALDESGVVHHADIATELLDIVEKSAFGDTGKRVLNPVVMA